jgi:hypothetical protein
MVTLTRNVKIWVLASLISLFIFNFYWIIKSYENFFGYFLQVPEYYSYVNNIGIVFWAGHIGLTARFAGLLLGLVAVFLLWVKAWSFSKVKIIVASALVLEAVNFLGLLPSAQWLLKAGTRVYSPALGIDYLLQFLLITPFLWALAYQVVRYRGNEQPRGFRKWVAAAFVVYVSALVINEFSRWATMISWESLKFLQGIRLVGFLNAVAFLPLAVVFAVVGAYFLVKQNDVFAMRWFGVSLAVMGLHYAIYLVYSYAVNTMNTVLLVDVWTVPLLGLGIAMIVSSRTRSK